MLLGSAMRGNGVLRLMKALRHEAPGIAETARRLGAAASKDMLAYVFKTVHLQHGGKLSFARVLTGRLDDGATLQASSGEAGRVSGISALHVGQDNKRSSAEAGETVALGKLDTMRDRRHLVEWQDCAKGASARRAAIAGAGDGGCRRGPQG